MHRFSRHSSRRSLLQGLGAAAVGLSFAPLLSGCGQSGGSKDGNGEEAKLNFYNWDTYIGKTTLADFKAATGISVNMTLFASNDELFAKLRGGNPGYDVIVPSNETVTRLAEANLLMKLDHAKLPNMANLAPQFRDAVFDRGRQYSMPYTWGIIGIGYRKSKVKALPDSWKLLFDSGAYKGRIALVSESADLIRLGAKYLGHSILGVGPEMIAKVEAMLIKQKPNIKTFHDDNGQDLLLAGDVDLVMENAGDIAQVMREDKDLDFVIPKEGSLLYQDCLCIPAGAPRPDNAHRFINYILDGAAGAAISKTILYATPNAAAKKLMPDDYQNNPVIFPSGPAMDKSEYGLFEGAAQASQFEEAMTRIRAA
jgi:spermidine/putrescine transport system substrate-binding protein